jgi:hypothetical protein
LLIAEAGIDHRPAIAVGQQIDVHVIEPERQLEPYPEHARHHLDDLIGAGVIFPRVSQCLGGGLHHICFRVHRIDLPAHLARR